MSRPSSERRTGSRRSAATAGAGTLSIFGTNRVSRLVDAVLSEDPWARDARNLNRDFRRAQSAAKGTSDRSPAKR